MSDGSSFAGTLGASPTGTVAISGSTRLVLARALTSADDGSQQWTVIATQNETTVSFLDLGSSHPFEPTAATAAADATIIIVGTGSVTTIDGVWQFGAVNGK